MAQKKSVARKATAPKKTKKKVVPTRPTYERLVTARNEADAADDEVAAAIRRLNREKAFMGDFTQRDRLVDAAIDDLALARENASEARANFKRLSTEARR